MEGQNIDDVDNKIRKVRIDIEKYSLFELA